MPATASRATRAGRRARIPVAVRPGGEAPESIAVPAATVSCEPVGLSAASRGRSSATSCAGPVASAGLKFDARADSVGARFAGVTSPDAVSPDAVLPDAVLAETPLRIAALAGEAVPLVALVPTEAGPRNGNCDRSSTAPRLTSRSDDVGLPVSRLPAEVSHRRPNTSLRPAGDSPLLPAASVGPPAAWPEPDESSGPSASATALRARAPNVIRVGGATSSCPGAPARPASGSSAPAADRVAAGAACTCGSEVGPVRSHGGTVTSGSAGAWSSSSDRGRSVTPSPFPPAPSPAPVNGA